jgi:uncharacterized membrane protein (DUF4010 family)
LDINSIISRLLLAILLGAFVGLERDHHLFEDNDKDGVDDFAKKQQLNAEKAAKKFSFIKSAIPAVGLGGLRTYIMISLLGAVSGVAALYGYGFVVWIFGFGVIAFILISYILNYFDKNTLGLTTEISIMLSFLLSYLMLASDIDLRIIVSLYIISAVILSIKSETHEMIKKFSRKEIIDSTKFALFSIVILQFLPDRVIPVSEIPYLNEYLPKILSGEFIETLDIFNPYRLWLLVVFISGINFIGYFLVKVFGKNRGMNILGMLGGLISSTAVTEAMAIASRNLKKPEDIDIFLNSALLSNMVSFIRIVLVVALINIELAITLVVPMTVMALFIWLWYLISKGRGVGDINDKAHKKMEGEVGSMQQLEKFGLSFTTPFSFKPAIAFGFLYLLVLIFTKTTHYFLGDSGFLVSSMVAAMTGLDVVTINTATLAGDVVSIANGALVLVIAVAANLVIKAVLAMMLGNRYYVSRLFILFTAAIVLGVGSYVIQAMLIG